MREINYVGNSPVMLKYLLQSSDFRVCHCVCEERKLSEEYKQIAQQYGVVLHEINYKKQLTEFVNHEKRIPCVMYDFGIIIPSDVLNQVNIFNFHPGSLRTNRGPSPVNWSILLNEKETEMSLYQINEKIDLGLLIATEKMQILKTDVPSTLRKKLEATIPMLLKQLTAFLNGEISAEWIESGDYRKRIEEKDYTIYPEVDSESVIDAKIRSQADFKGAVLWLRGGQYFVRSMSEYYKISDKLEDM